MKPRFWYCETFKMNFYFCIGWRPEAFSKYMKRRFQYDFDARLKDGVTLLCESDQGRIIVIWTRKKDYPILAHECVHAAHCTLDAIAHKPSFVADEPVAYLVESIFRKAVGK